MGSSAAGSVIQLVRAGGLRALSVIREFRSSSWTFRPLPSGLYAPAATPRWIVSGLSAALNKIVGDQAPKERFANIGFDPTAAFWEE